MENNFVFEDTNEGLVLHVKERKNEKDEYSENSGINFMNAIEGNKHDYTSIKSFDLDSNDNMKMMVANAITKLTHSKKTK